MRVTEIGCESENNDVLIPNLVDKKMFILSVLLVLRDASCFSEGYVVGT